MVPDKFNMVDMGGIDIILMQGEEVEGLYDKLVESIAQCRYQCLYNWYFDDVLIPPTYVSMSIENDIVFINSGVSVDEDDIIHIYSIEPDPSISPLSITENGTYEAPSYIDGYNPVTVDVPDTPPVTETLSVTENGTYTPSSGVDGFSSVVVNVPQPAPVIAALSVAQNGTYTASSGTDGYSPITVNVPTEYQRPSVSSDYQEVEYLDFTPSIGIIVSLPTSGNFLFECEFSSDTDTPSASSCAFGYRQSTSNGKDFEFHVANGYFKSYLRTASDSNGVSFGDVIQCTPGKKEKVRVVLINPRNTAYVGKYAAYSSPGVDSMALDGKFYYANAIDMITGEYSVWFVPCYRKSDNQIGVYDVINNTFYYNTYSVGSGYSIVAGPDVN